MKILIRQGRGLRILAAVFTFLACPVLLAGSVASEQSCQVDPSLGSHHGAGALAPLGSVFVSEWIGTQLLVYADKCGQNLEWALSCPAGRDCVSHHKGFDLRLDLDGSLIFQRDLAPGATVSYILANRIFELPGFFDHPTDNATEHFLKAGGYLLIENGGGVRETIATTGLKEVAQTLRNLTGHFRKPTPPVLYPHSDEDGGLNQSEAKQVPFTKPQIEFAVRAQGGESFAPQNRNSTTWQN